MATKLKFGLLLPLFANRGYCRENQQALYMGVVFTFHAMGFENQVISDPNRVKSVSLGLLRTFDA